MKWGWVKAFPKFALVFVVIVGSTIAFGFWWYVLRIPKNAVTMQGHIQSQPPAEDVGPKLATIVAKHDRLILVDNDLYDTDDGTLLFKSWLEKGMPERLFYDSEAKKIIAQYELGFVRYSLSGKVEATLLQRFRPAVSKDWKWVLYVKDKDIFRADIDWNEFKLVNERKLTSIEQFWPQGFVENIFFWTDKTLIVRNLSNPLRVNLETGDVKPIRISLEGITGPRSPDTKNLVGVQGGQFYCYNVDTDMAKTIPIGRVLINDYQWLGNDKCVAIAAGKDIVLYDRLKNTLSEVMTLPFQCSKIGAPSPDYRFVFCNGWGRTLLVDLQNKTTLPIAGGWGPWVSNDTFAFSRDVPNTELRGTFLQTAGEMERRISPEPYLIYHTGPALMELQSASMMIFAAQHGLSKMKLDGSDVTELIDLRSPPKQVLAITDWNRASTNEK
jgi:hypothetical protein